MPPSCVSNVCRNMYKETVQRYLMRLRVNFDGCLKITFAADKSKVGRYQTTLAYV